MEASRARDAMIRRLQKEGHIVSPRVVQAMGSVPREAFLPQSLRDQAYDDRPLPIGEEQTMSAPHMVAIMCESLLLEAGQRVLEIGTGSGYHAAVTAALVAPGGSVVTVERLPALARSARRHLEEAGIQNAEVVEGDGSSGYAVGAPYHRIYVTCAAPRVPPPMLHQLRDDGILLLPVGRKQSQLIRVRRRGSEFDEEDLGPCAFVPLVGTLGDRE